MKSRVFHYAAAILDADRLISPGAILTEGDDIIAVGSPASLGAPGLDVPRIHHRAVLIPALANAHTHLDLSALGPRPYTGSFDSWVDLVRSHRSQDPDRIREAVTRGVRLSWAGGVAAVGDIAGIRSVEAVHALQRSGMAGVSYLEFFGIGGRRQASIDWLAEFLVAPPRLEGPIRLGLQPHAPYSCDPALYHAAATSGLPLATHLAETLDEIQFTRNGDGPLRDMLQRIGVWDPSVIGAGLHPIDLLAEPLRSAPFIAAHVNYPEPQHLDLMASWPVTVAYCPRASAYFGHPAPGHQPHQYQAMIDRGLNVVVATDSLICLDTPDRISPLDDLRMLSRRDGTAPKTLIRLSTVNAAEALGLDPLAFRFSIGRVAGVLAIDVDNESDPIADAFRNSNPPRWILGPHEGATWR